MKIHSNNFKKKMITLGRELDCVATYNYSGKEYTLSSEEINGATLCYDGAILKSVMKELTLDSNSSIPLNTVVNFKFGLKINNSYEYLDYGNYIVYSCDKGEDTNSYKIKCYDKLLYSMKEYENLDIEYPITIRDYISAISSKIGVTFANSSDIFANYDKLIEKELYLDNGYTYRDVLDELAQVTASIICINKDDKLEIRYINDTNDTIDEEYFDENNVRFGEKFGPVNSIVLSRSANSDNIYKRDEESISTNGLCEIKISDNQIMNWNNRDTFLDDILDKLVGLEFYVNDYSSKGICYYELGDKYTAKIRDKAYTCLMLNDEITIEQGISENVYTNIISETQTDYSKSDKTDRRINQVYLIVNKQENRINALVSEQKQIKKDITTSKTAEGNPIEIDDAGEYELQNIQIYGPTSNNGYLELKTSSKNLFNKDDYISFYAHIANGNLSYNAGNKVLIFPCAHNKTYTISKKSGGRFRIGSYPTFEQQGITLSNYNSSDSASSLTITTGPKDRYIYVEYWLNIEEAAENEIIGSIQIETGNKSTSYEEHKENIALIYLNIYDDNKNIIGYYEIDEGDKFDNGILTKSDGTQIELPYEKLKLFKGYNYITVKDDLYPNMNIKYLTDSKFNADYATKSEFNMKSNEILSEVNGKFKEYTKTTEMNASIKEQVNSETAKIEISVSQRIEDIQIGGTNLVPNSEEEKVYIPDGWISLCEVEPASYGEEYTISFDAWVVYAQEESGYDGIVAKIGTYIEGDAFAGVKEIHATLTTKPQRITYTYTINNDDEPNAKIFGLGAWADSENETIHYRKIKVEKGNKATDWSPAPEDKANTSQVSRAAIMATITKNGTSSIDMESDEFSLTSKNFSVTKEGIVTALLGIFGGWNIGKDGIWREIRPDYDYTQNDINIRTDIFNSRRMEKI